MNLSGNILYLVILIFSVVIHEVAHGYAARRNGDETAEMSGRLTLNPISHIDLFGSIVLPAILILIHSPILLGWAKPVPVNPGNFKNMKKGMLEVSLAGVFANFLLAIVFGFVARFGSGWGIPASAMTAVYLIVLVNIVLGFFNLIPIPPLDGSKVVFALLPARYRYIENFLNKYAFVILIAFIFLGSSIVLEPLVKYSFFYLTGTNF
jgi:Zn-dependent protease